MSLIRKILSFLPRKKRRRGKDDDGSIYPMY